MSLIYKLGAALVACLLLVAGFNKWNDHVGDQREALVVQRYDKAIADLKTQAGIELAAAKAKTQVAEKLLSDSKTQQELTDAANTKTVLGLQGRLKLAAGPAGRLRDPFATSTGCGSRSADASSPSAASAGDSPEDPAPPGGLLSAEITRLLFDEAQTNDAINLAYISCRADAFKVREVLAQ